jgi:hypothetical protein
MKKYPLPLLILALFLVFSCKKSNSGGKSTASSTYLSSAVSFAPQQKIVDSFSFDSLYRLTQFSQFTYDSTSGSPLYNSSTVLFEGTIDDNLIDTLFLTNGNIGSEHVYNSDIPGQPDVLNGDVQYGFSSTANPAYHSAITSSIGPLLATLEINGFGGFVDFISKNAFNKLSGVANGLPSGTGLNYTLTNDSKEGYPAPPYPIHPPAFGQNSILNQQNRLIFSSHRDNL